MEKTKLDREEQILEDEIGNGEWAETENMEKEIKHYRLQAKKFLSKKKNINIRLTEWDYNKIKARAAEDGLPYQTLVSSLIHQYLSGKIKAV
jgi:predicted DNA binding CopG/RHH family protein